MCKSVELSHILRIVFKSGHITSILQALRSQVWLLAPGPAISCQVVLLDRKDELGDLLLLHRPAALVYLQLISSTILISGTNHFMKLLLPRFMVISQ